MAERRCRLESLGADCQLQVQLQAGAWCFSLRCPKRLSARLALAVGEEELLAETEEVLHQGEAEALCRAWVEGSEQAET